MNDRDIDAIALYESECGATVWDQHLARVSDLAADPAWPMGRSATYKAIERGQIPVVTFAGTKFVVMSDLRRMLGINGAEVAS